MSTIDLEPDPTLDELAAELHTPVQALLKAAAAAKTEAKREALMMGALALLQDVEEVAQRAWKREFGIESGPSIPAPQVLTEEAKGCVSQQHVHTTCLEAIQTGDLRAEDTCPWCQTNVPQITSGPPVVDEPGPAMEATSIFSPANTSVIHIITKVGEGSVERKPDVGTGSAPRKPAARGATRFPRKKKAS